MSQNRFHIPLFLVAQAMRGIAKAQHPSSEVKILQAKGMNTVVLQRFRSVLSEEGEVAPFGVLVVPGFASAHVVSKDTGVLGDLTHRGGMGIKADFYRMTFPEALANPHALSYPHMVNATRAAMDAVPNEHLVTVGISFGGGLMTHAIAGSVYDDRRPVSAFGIVAAGACSLVRLFKQQAGFPAFKAANDPKAELLIHSPTLGKPFPMTKAQYDGILPFAKGEEEIWCRHRQPKPYALLPIVEMIYGEKDKESRWTDSAQLKKMMTHHRGFETCKKIKGAGHRLPSADIHEHFSTFMQTTNCYCCS